MFRALVADRENGGMTAFVVEHDSPLTVWGQIHRDLRHRIDAEMMRDLVDAGLNAVQS